jgi:hypothetical protein
MGNEQAHELEYRHVMRTLTLRNVLHSDDQSSTSYPQTRALVEISCRFRASMSSSSDEDTVGDVLLSPTT